MESETVKNTVVWQWRKEEGWRKTRRRVKVFVGWFLLILLLNGIGWMLGSVLVR